MNRITGSGGLQAKNCNIIKRKESFDFELELSSDLLSALAFLPQTQMLITPSRK